MGVDECKYVLCYVILNNKLLTQDSYRCWLCALLVLMRRLKVVREVVFLCTPAIPLVLCPPQHSRVPVTATDFFLPACGNARPYEHVCFCVFCLQVDVFLPSLIKAGGCSEYKVLFSRIMDRSVVSPVRQASITLFARLLACLLVRSFFSSVAEPLGFCWRDNDCA